MPRFSYKAKNGPETTVEGELDAESHAAAMVAIDRMGYSPISIQEAGGVATGRFRHGRIRHSDITVFTRQLASLTKSGVPILKALSTIAGQSENPRLRRVVEILGSEVRDGKMLSAAMAQFRTLFPELYINMVRAGEAGGLLDTMLFRVAEAREREEETRRKVQAALAYPLLVLLVGVTTIFVLLAFFLPRILDLFKDYRNLPLPTRILIEISEFMSSYWYWILIAVLLIGAILNRLATLERGRLFFDRIKLHLPLVRHFIRDADIARFARTLALLIDAGIPIDRALSLCANTLRNAVFKGEIEAVRRDTVQQGMPFSVGLKRTKYFPVFVANMAGVGEEAGRLDESLAEIASFYERQFEQGSRLATALLEPILILVVGAIVGFIVAAMLLPVFQLGTGG